MNKKLAASIVSVATGASLMAGLMVTPVSADTMNAGVSAPTTQAVRRAQNQADRIPNIIARANLEIDRRVVALNSLSSAISGMKKVSVEDKASLSAQIQTELGFMTTLKTKIDADTDLAVLKTDVQSITESYRVFALILPKGRITAAADRMGTIADDMTTLSGKLQVRIAAAQAAGKDVTALQASLNDLNLKVADAKSQYAAAESGIANLVPDKGDQTVFQSNKTALLDARAKIKAGAADLKTGRDDAKTIVAGLKGFHLNASTTATTTVSH